MSKNQFYLILAAAGIILILGTAKFGQAATADHLVISEVQITGGTGKTTNDFIELYNPTATAINLNGYRLVKRTKTGTSDTLIKSWTSDTSIAAHGFYLWANSDYTDIPVAPDVTTSVSVANDNGVAIRHGANDTGEIIDSVGWGECQNIFVETTDYPINPGANQSFARKPGGDQGNGEDTNDNSQDFVATSSPNPQNTSSSPKPTISGPVCGNSICETGENSTNCPADCPVANNNNGTINIYTPHQVQPGDILINEIFPQPDATKGEGEWIELYNHTANAAIDLTGWTIEDNTAKPVILTGIILAPRQYYVLDKSKFSFVLNNGGDTLILKNNQTVIDRIAYGDYEDGNTDDNAPAPGLSKSIGRQNTEPIDTDNDKNDFKICQSITPGRVNDVAAATATTTASTITTSSTPNYQNTSVIISEFLPNPTGNDSGEWIELYNSGGGSVNLSGWQIDDGDGGSNPYTLPADTMIAAAGYLILPRSQTKIILNNNFDSVRLIQPDKIIHNWVDYKNPPEGASYARGTSGIWAYTSAPTPGSANVFPNNDDESGTADLTNEAQNADSAIQLADNAANNSNLVDVDDLPQLDNNQAAMVQGAVVALPGLFAKSYFYINGAQIYSFAGNFPNLRIGDLIEVRGMVSSSFSNRRLKIKSPDHIQILEHQSLSPQPVAIGELDNSLIGYFLQINGQLIDKIGGKLYLGDGQDEIEVYLSPAIKWNKKVFKEGQILQVNGILTETKNGWRLLPRSDNDLTVSAAAINGPLGDNQNPANPIATESQNSPSAATLTSSVATVWQNLNRPAAIKYLFLSAGTVIIFLTGIFLKLKGVI